MNNNLSEAGNVSFPQLTLLHRTGKKWVPGKKSGAVVLVCFPFISPTSKAISPNFMPQSHKMKSSLLRRVPSTYSDDPAAVNVWWVVTWVIRGTQCPVPRNIMTTTHWERNTSARNTVISAGLKCRAYFAC